MSDAGSSSAEKCGFVTHLIVIFLGGCYLLGLALPDRSVHPTTTTSGDFSWANDLVAVASHPIWNRYLPTASLGVFLIAPLIYAFLNHLSAPQSQSVATLQDSPTFACATNAVARRYDRPGLLELRMLAEVAPHTYPLLSHMHQGRKLPQTAAALPPSRPFATWTWRRSTTSCGLTPKAPATTTSVDLC